MLKLIAAAALSAFILYDAAVAPGFTGTIEVSAPQRALKGDRLPMRPSGPACSQAAWPNYESGCVRRAPSGAQPSQVREVRIVAIDRPAATRPAAPSVN